ncbi:DUF3618 domain-containing protein [Kutzneria kofuensis]|uniref:DUF3618 domain-containing protein n=1 Tax=Kutzneria kofuensis TaxID=103725 RepID=A0A7W9NM69_9PSEU|nr:DUF3618 domain-containing protein [Kutzneria kofuensis]MBB5897201.1 hypothetical protein [Kutzneria kofuensis]
MSSRPDDPALLREEIERTREEIVDTIARLHGKVDRARKVPAAVIAVGGLGVLVLVVLLLRRR